MERMVNNRLLKYLEENHILNDCQSGYRKNRSTEDQTTYLAQEIEDAFQKKQKLLATFFDLSKAFDKVWKDGLLLKLANCGVNGRMLVWIRDFLTRRCARVKTNNKLSNLVYLHEGVPQGGVLSPTLFLVFINDLPQQFTPYVHRALHADDLAIWTQADSVCTAQARMQDAISKVEQWARDWGVTINESKTVSTLFSLCTKPEPLKLIVNNTEIPVSSTAKYLCDFRSTPDLVQTHR